MYRLACLFLLALLVGCKPEQNNEAVPENPEPGIPILAETADSLGNARKDGTRTTADIPLDLKQQLPAMLEVNLDRRHGLWQYPVLTDRDARRVPEDQQGPYFLEADFNGDGKLDYAVQIVERDSAHIYAFLSGKDVNELEEFLLEKHPLTQIEGKNRSIRYLTLARKDAQLHDQATGKKFVLPRDAINVGVENSAATYVFENGTFKRYETAD